MNGWESLLPFALIIAVFWFLVARPARRQQRKLAATQAGIDIGTEVMLGSGIYGTVSSLEEETIQIQVAPGTQLKVARQAVVRILDPADRIDPDGPSGTTDQSSAGA